MKNVLIFSGTTEGRRLAETLVKNGIFCHVCVATEYGLQVMESSELMQVHMGRLDVDAMKELYADIRPDVVIDATHPFAKIVSENIRESLRNLGFLMCVWSDGWMRRKTLERKKSLRTVRRSVRHCLLGKGIFCLRQEVKNCIFFAGMKG